MLPKKYRLSAKEFQNLYKNGFKVKGKYGMLISKLNSRNTPLFGFVVSKKIGKAVQRNRMTRLLRVISMEAVKEFELKGRNFQYIAFEFCDSYQDLKEEFFSQVKQILENEENSALVN
jgi:ribonuclease P protein component